TLEIAGDLRGLERSGQTEKQRRRACKCGSIDDALPRFPSDVVEESDAAIVRRRHQRLPAPRGVAIESRGDRRVTRLMTKCSKSGDGALSVVHQTVEIDRDEIRRLERAQIG